MGSCVAVSGRLRQRRWHSVYRAFTLVGSRSWGVTGPPGRRDGHPGAARCRCHGHETTEARVTSLARGPAGAEPPGRARPRGWDAGTGRPGPSRAAGAVRGLAARQLPVRRLPGPGQRAAPRRHHRPPGRRDRGGRRGVGHHRGSDLRPGRPPGRFRHGLARPLRRPAGKTGRTGRTTTGPRTPSACGRQPTSAAGCPQGWWPRYLADPEHRSACLSAVLTAWRSCVLHEVPCEPGAVLAVASEPGLRAGDQLRPAVRRARPSPTGEPGLHRAADRAAHRQPLPRPGARRSSCCTAWRRRRRRRLGLVDGFAAAAALRSAGPGGVRAASPPRR